MKGGTTTVKAKNNMIANKGSQYGSSNGDEAGTAGGVKSGVNMKATDWITYSFDVKMDGKNACRHTDKKFHNNQNAADLQGNIDPATGKPWMKCGEIDTYGRLCSNGKAARPRFERDHIPAKAQLFARARKHPLFKSAKRHRRIASSGLRKPGACDCHPTSAHRGFSPTCGSRNTPSRIASDASSKQSMQKAANRDTLAMQKHLDKKARTDRPRQGLREGLSRRSQKDTPERPRQDDRQGHRRLQEEVSLGKGPAMADHEDYRNWARHFGKSTLHPDLVAEFRRAGVAKPPVIKRNMLEAYIGFPGLTVNFADPVVIPTEEKVGAGVGILYGIAIHLDEVDPYQGWIPMRFSPVTARPRCESVWASQWPATRRSAGTSGSSTARR